MNIFEDPAFVQGYASSRPQVHPRIVDAACAATLTAAPVRRALDVGAGCGLSTRALAPWAETRFGLEPVPAMAAAAPAVDPGAHFLAAAAETLPFPSATFHLLTAAGSLNYVRDIDRALAEARRVLVPEGLLLVYDFSAGRTSPAAPRLAGWFGEFTRRFPTSGDGALPLDPESIAALAHGFSPVWSSRLTITLPVDLDFYCRYLMTETNVAWAVRQGAHPHAIRATLHDSLTDSLTEIFSASPLPIEFPGYAAVLRKD